MTAPSITPLPRQVVLVGNPNSGHVKDGMARARAAIVREGLQILETVRLHELERLRSWVNRPDDEHPLIVAAGGDGTIGGVCGYVAGTGAVLGIVPLGTSNDIARSFDIPMRIEDAVHLFTTGKIATADLGRFATEDGEERYFAHAAAMGVDVAFAKLATRGSWRKRLGRLTYIAAGLTALHDRAPFTCELRLGDPANRTVKMCLIHLSVIDAPIFGGRLGLRLGGSSVDDRRLDVLAIEDAPLYRLLLTMLPVLFMKRPRVGGVRVSCAATARPRRPPARRQPRWRDSRSVTQRLRAGSRGAARRDWARVRGRGRLVDGRWSMVDGRWSMVSIAGDS